METVTLNAPIGHPAASVLGSDGVIYPIISGKVTLPPNAANALHALGFYSASATPGTTVAYKKG